MPTFQTAAGVRIHYRDEGSGGPPLLLVHGSGCSLRQWDYQARPFRRTHRVVRMDLRGHGRSDAPPGGYTRRTFAGDVEELARHLDVTGAVVVGHSMGAPIALELATRAPDVVRALVLVDGLAGLGLRGAERDAHPWLQMFAAPDHPLPVVEMLTALLDGVPRPVVEQVLADAAATPQRVALAMMRQTVVGAGPSPRWRRLRLPILYVGASHGRQTAESLRQVLPHAEFAQVVGAGHWVQLEVPEQLNAMLGRFLVQLDASAATPTAVRAPAAARAARRR